MTYFATNFARSIISHPAYASIVPSCAWMQVVGITMGNSFASSSAFQNFANTDLGQAVSSDIATLLLHTLMAVLKCPRHPSTGQPVINRRVLHKYRYPHTPSVRSSFTTANPQLRRRWQAVKDQSHRCFFVSHLNILIQLIKLKSSSDSPIIHANRAGAKNLPSKKTIMNHQIHGLQGFYHPAHSLI